MASITQAVALLSFVVPASAPVAGAARTIQLAGPARVRDLEFGGLATMAGTTKIKGSPSDAATRARVSILRLRDKALARQVWSDQATGAWSVSGLNADREQYIALAEYPSNPADPEAANYLRPVAGVSPLVVLP